MHEKIICKTCKYSKVKHKHNYTIRQCRRYAPRKIHGSAIGYVKELFPEVKDDDWCGEWDI